MITPALSRPELRFFPEFHITAFKTDEERRAAASLSVTERQKMITNLIVPHRRFKNGLEFVRDRFHRPVDGGNHAAGWIGGVIGEARTGKSFLVQYYASKNPPVFGERGWRIPVAYLEAREDWDRIEFARQIFTATGASTIPRMTIASMNSTVTRRLRQMETELLIIDDAHFLFQVSRFRSSSHASLLQHIANQKQCNILLVGLPNVKEAIVANDQLYGRGQFPSFTMKEFDHGKPSGRSRLKIFLADVDARLPFPSLSNLHKEEYLHDFITFGGGSVGKIVMNLIIPAGYMAINRGSPFITREFLRIAAEDRLPSGQTLVPFRDREEPK
ncbi:AAA family ATPase [Rhizobium sp. NZLR1b]|uniref:TniB family NTP-binding protein n=1 Tax=Rhizobium sp. NZLR1b TaxID=2731099 RepID=UPI001C830474|nr:TniB family NTP-binding protein [Rhizobium sp. NZLR1b]MBX5168785.1 AAA family ATPase [Rhizobium sp. NZLR1b]